MFKEASASLDLNHLITNGSQHWISFEIDGGSEIPEIPVGTIVFVDEKEKPYLNCAMVVQIAGKYYVRCLREEDRELKLVSANGRRIHESTEPQFGRGKFLGVVGAHLVLYHIVCAEKKRVYL